MKNYFIFILLLFPVLAAAQFLSNPSFEGPTGANIVPPHWQPCKLYSTPDTQPGAWACVTPPSDGSSYSNLITRGSIGPYANSTEDMQAALLKPLLAGNYYLLSIDLARSDEWGHWINFGDDWLSYYHQVRLKIWGGYGSCQKSELFWISDPIFNTSWVTYTITIFPSAEINYLILEAEYAYLPEYFGNVLIDNIVMKISIPNVFTPNNDGKNEFFLIKNLPPNSALQIFNRWGGRVYESGNYNNQWDGGGVPDGTYYYILVLPTKENYRGFVEVRR